MRGSRLVSAVVAAALALVAAGCSTSGGGPASSTTPAASPGGSASVPASTVPASSSTSTSPSTTTATTRACVSLASWSDERLAAETVIVPADENDVTFAAPEVSAGAGGVVLFGASAPSDLGAQLASLQSSSPGDLGALVMTDEEGGGVQRMANLVGSLPWANYMGQHWSPAEITSQVTTIARNMASDGISMDLAPVVDVDGRNVAPGASDPDGWRSFSGTTSVVSADGVAFMRGLEDGGVIPVLKHFPGLGGSSGNTDNGPAHTLAWSTLQKAAIPPFVAGIDAGAPAIMISNAVVPGLSTLPASLSSAVVTGELVGTLHFNGLIITDSLSAGAISGAGFSVTQASVQAIRSGADMVMYTSEATSSASQQQFRAIVSAEVSAVAHGEFPRSRLVAAAAAVLASRHLPVCG